MNEKLQNAITAIQEQFGSAVQEFKGEQTLFVEPANLVKTVALLWDKFGFKLFASLTATDYWPAEEPRFHLSYQFHNVDDNISLRLRVPLAGDDPTVPTLEGVFNNAT